MAIPSMKISIMAPMEHYVEVFKNFKLCSQCEQVKPKEQFKGRLCRNCYNIKCKLIMRKRYKTKIKKKKEEKKLPVVECKIEFPQQLE